MNRYFISIIAILFIGWYQLSATGCNTSSQQLTGDTTKKTEASDTSKSKSSIDTVTISDSLIWYDFETGYAKAVSEGKILLVDAYTDWCHWCKVMDAKTYTDKSIIYKINSDFVAVKFNPEKNKSFQFGSYKMNNDELLYWLGSGRSYGYPSTFFWVNPGSQVGTEKIMISVGYEEVGRFTNTLNTVKAKKGT